MANFAAGFIRIFFCSLPFLALVWSTAITCDNSNPSARLDCGYNGINQTQCTGKGCCWGPLDASQSYPWCFYSTPTSTTGATSTSTTGGTDVWGWITVVPLCGPSTPSTSTITSTATSTPTSTSTSTSCSNSDASSRNDCGNSSTNQSECVGKGCCWGPLSVPGPWCFYPAA